MSKKYNNNVMNPEQYQKMKKDKQNRMKSKKRK